MVRVNLDANNNNSGFLSNCLIGTFNDPFSASPKPEVIQSWFTKRWQVTAGLRVTHLSHNQFLFHLPSKQEATRIKEGEWFWNGRRLSLGWWSPVSGTQMNKVNSEHVWIRALGVPLHTWSEGTFKAIGDLCGGFVGVDVETKNKLNLFWARICVKVCLSEPPSRVEVEVGDWKYWVSIVPDDFCKISRNGVSGVPKTVDTEVGTSMSKKPVVVDDRHVRGHVGVTQNLNFELGQRTGPLVQSTTDHL